jgi:flavorubredoxin
MILELYPDAQVLCSTKGKELLASLLQIPTERCRVVDDGESVSLGDRSLQFFITPWVHWPDTMLTFMPEEKILFSCDFLGAHLATSDLYATDEVTVYESAKRYYAEIMMPFRTSIVTHLETIKNLDISMIAPSHGPIHHRPPFILDAYREWSSEVVKNEAVIAYVSMHGSTQAMAEYLAAALTKRGVRVQIFNLAVTDIGELAKSLVDPATLVLGTPTVLFGPHPLAAYAAFLANALHPKVRAAAIFGSFGWGGTTVQQLTGALNHLKVDLHEPVFVRGTPGERDFRSLDALAQAIHEKHKSFGIVPEHP